MKTNIRFFGVGPISTEPRPMYEKVPKLEQDRQNIAYSLTREDLEKNLERLREYREVVPILF